MATAPLPRRIADTFVAPRRLARALDGAAPPWFDTLAVVVAIGIVAVFLVPDEFFLEQARDAVDRRGRPVEITSDAGTIARWGRYLAMLTALAQWPLLVLALAGVLTLLFSSFGRGRLGFRNHLAIAAHGFLVLSLQQLLALGAMLALGAATAPLSLASLVPAHAVGDFAHSFLELVSPFALWMLAVIAVAIATLDERVGSGRAAAVLIGGYLALALALVVTTLTR